MRRVSITLGLLALLAQPADAQPTALQRCEELAGLAIPAAAIGLPTGGAAVTTARRLAETPPRPHPDGEFAQALPVHCNVQGEIRPVDPAAPRILFNVNLPLSWNGRALQSGGGGLGGSVITAPGQKASARFDPVPLTAPYPIALGYATFGGDGGHQGNDVAFMRNDEAMRNWGVESMKKTRDVALRVIEAAYGSAPTRVIFNGESAGGREALMVAQRFPDDYDGVIAVSPVLSWFYIHLADNHIRSLMVSGWLDAAAVRLVAERTRQSCDEADGVRDGIIARYLECPNDVATLRCPDGARGQGCLSDAQIAVVNAIREPWSMQVPLAHGITRYPGFGVTGDEDAPRYQWPFYVTGAEPPSFPLPPGRGFEPRRGAVLNFAAILVRHAIVQDEAFDPFHFQATRHAARLQYLSTLFDATDPDLTRFRARGGKLILLQPAADNAVGTPMVAEYYRSVVARMGQAETDSFLRFYVTAGSGHNVVGPSQFDTLSILEGWLDGTAPPDAPAAFDIHPETLQTVRSMPACRYPAYARYSGSGDPNRAESFTCTARPDPLGFAPAR
ncbi:tannase/feruloyl esterase family alpha/beta hydrolase [Falsiroseomonas ponticola]|uniref:tannase/feruloyl esterase family alpha/beta hydrolase n=1 Tax=Falsiroseomonas ponticola TaxID=2786951 RepID=UPI0019348D67|nr:tannase/feruloyl esterase family alpha/beta hydrolase [Roseomonas ponticola]